MSTLNTLRRRLAWRLVDTAEVVLAAAHRIHATAPASLYDYAADLAACGAQATRRRSDEAMRRLYDEATGEDREAFAKAAALIGVELQPESTSA